MALHNSFKQGQSQQQGTRLGAVPTTEDLTYALAQAAKSGKNPIVISWKNSKTTTVFWLSVTASSGGNEAEWLLQKGEENAQPKNVWNHKTIDTNLIQSLVSAEEEMAFKSGGKTPTGPSLEELNQQRDNSPGNKEWDATASNPDAPIVLSGGFQPPTARSSAPPKTPPQWPGNEVSGWNAPQPAPDQLGFGQKAVQNPESDPNGTPANLFAGLKGTVEAPQPVNPFNALMSNQSLPQLPQQQMPNGNQAPPQPPQQAMSNSNQSLPQAPQQAMTTSNQSLPLMPEQERYGSSLPKDDPSVNPYDALTNSGAGIKQVKQSPPPPPPQPPAPLPASLKSYAPPPSALLQHSAQSPSMHKHPHVPNFAAMSSSGAFPVLQVSPDQALNPKSTSQANANQNKAPFVINEVSAPPAPTPPGNQQPPQIQTNSAAPAPNNAPPATPQSTDSKSLPVPLELDKAAVDTVFKSLSNPETGLLNHASFLFFFVREFSRYQCNYEPFSLIIMEMNVMISGSVGSKLPRRLPPRGVRAAAEKIFSLTRQLDLVAHYGETEFAILLPATNRQQATEFAQAVSKALLSKPLLPDMEPKSLVLHMGVASFPEDTSHPGILLAAATEAKSAAHQLGKPVILFADK